MGSLRPGFATRLGLTSLLPGASCRAMVWAMLAAFRQSGLRPVPFLARACPHPYQALQRATGKCPRHLDSWSMTRDRCRDVFSAGVARGETGILIDAADNLARGQQKTVESCPACECPSNGNRVENGARARNFETLCQWLDLPKLGLVDARTLNISRHSRLPANVDGLLIDGVESPRQAARLQTELEAMWRVRVLGHLQLPAPVRALVDEWDGQQSGQAAPSMEVLSVLGEHLMQRWDEELLAEFMQRPAWPREFQITGRSPYGSSVRIAFAQDAAFGWCFPESLDALEQAGATLCDFSPLRSERLPEGTDLVYIGCGHPERYADELSRNHCLMQSLRCFAASGGRIYAEGSGAAYLSRQITLPNGTRANMSGLLPMTARLGEEASTPEQAEVTFGLGCWLADRNTTLRGYRALHWQFDPCGPMLTYAQDPRQRCDVLGRNNVIGSRILFNVAAFPKMLERFVRPCAPVGAALR